MLPVLKEVGVVDSGGQGLLFIYEGFLSALNGEFQADDTYEPSPAEMDEMVNAEHHRSVQGQLATEDIKFGYCTEIMVRLGKDQPLIVNLITILSVTIWMALAIHCWWSMMTRSLKYTCTRNILAKS